MTNFNSKKFTLYSILLWLSLSTNNDIEKILLTFLNWKLSISAARQILVTSLEKMLLADAIKLFESTDRHFSQSWLAYLCIIELQVNFDYTDMALKAQLIDD